ncbi:molybdopterin-guanine dinucleotide biosynthesis protein B [Paenibacillus sp. S150]|uniref:molybdopterin-guanine dinucleotide biosynthesis protein B n=1 Tax=Paenibacillus sp. S150 TaxID=2749826 RepID=UPI001C5734D2|nr:molybdopterin-guanine dinucleotide biosynthesis protein B [Paenibacillus sp. S150]MBW4080482.1 molybdopterin-guanine dinucleotide biosynthesis protein B [Paenibacillus sp. S150]
MLAAGRGNTRPAVCQIIGYKNSGKTTLICELIRQLRKKGCTVAVIKHDGHNFDMDHEGTDTWKQRQAGASAVAITSDARTSVIQERTSSLPGLLEAFADYDYVLVEGFKQEQYPKIVLIRQAEDIALLGEASRIAAMALWGPMQASACLPQASGIGRFDISDSAGMANLLWQKRSYFQNFNI